MQEWDNISGIILLMTNEEKDNILNGRANSDDPIDNALRPTSLEDLIGQDVVKDNLRIQIQAAKQRPGIGLVLAIQLPMGQAG